MPISEQQLNDAEYIKEKISFKPQNELSETLREIRVEIKDVEKNLSLIPSKNRTDKIKKAKNYLTAAFDILSEEQKRIEKKLYKTVSETISNGIRRVR